MSRAKRHFETPMITDELDTVLSVNNDAAVLSVAEFYPALDEPMGYDNSDEPPNSKFVVTSEQEQQL